MPPVIFNVGLFLGKRYMGDVIGLFCFSDFSIIKKVVNKIERVK